MSLSNSFEPSLSPTQIIDCLGEINFGIYECRNIDDIFNTTTNTVRQLLQSDRVLISCCYPHNMHKIIVESVDSNCLSILGKTFPNFELINNFAQVYKQDIINIDLQEFQRNYLELFTQFQVNSSFVVPILKTTAKANNNQNCLWGLLIVHQCSYLRQWQPLEVKLLQQLALQLSLAIHKNPNNLPQQMLSLSSVSDVRNAFTHYINPHELEGALHESEQQFRQIFQNAPIAISLVDYHTHRFIRVNPAHYQLLGYTISELAFLTFDDISHPDDLLHNLDYLQQFKFGEFDSFCMEKRFIKKNGDLVQTNITVSILPDQYGRPKFSLAMIEDISERRQSEDKLKASLLEKETLLKEIHHRVKNNLQIISSLLRLQARQIHDHLALEVFKESQNRVQAMALIHEKLYQSSSLAKIDCQEYITTLVQELFRCYQAHNQVVTFIVEVKQSSISIALATPFGLIINELVSNSLKYAFTEMVGGQIFISLQEQSQGQFILIISDNGKKLPKSLNFRKTKTLGLQLVCRLTKQINGTIELEQSQGTKFTIVFTTTSGKGKIE
ncbi:MAG: histidine kinase dimerization/phosphoacceptor domain -containing protein [Coleofasciculaceae cyanobacterium]